MLNFLDRSNGSLVGILLNNASVANFSDAFTTSGLLNPTSFIDSVTAYSFLYPMPGLHEEEFSAPVYGFRPRVMGRPPAAG